MGLQKCTTEEGLDIKYPLARDGFYVGQEGEFLLYDSLKKPIERITGKIVSLMEGKTSSLYAMLQTENGIRPARLL